MDDAEVLAWRDGFIEALDQTVLPHQVRTVRIGTVDELVQAITSLAIRGAPLLGAAGALGVALAVRQGREEGWDDERISVRCEWPVGVACPGQLLVRARVPQRYVVRHGRRHALSIGAAVTGIAAFR